MPRVDQPRSGMQLAAGKIRKRTPEEEAEEEALSRMTVSERLAYIKSAAFHSAPCWLMPAFCSVQAPRCTGKDGRHLWHG